jgi:hypothetical protein
LNGIIGLNMISETNLSGELREDPFAARCPKGGTFLEDIAIIKESYFK